MFGRYTEMTSHVLQTHTDHEVVALGDLLPTELKATLKKVGGISLTPSQSSDIHVTLQTDSQMKELTIFGHVMASSLSPSQSTWSSKSAARMGMEYSVKVETKSSVGERYPYGGLQVIAELRPMRWSNCPRKGDAPAKENSYTVPRVRATKTP